MCREISPDLLSSSLSILSSPARYGHSAMVDPPLPLSVIIIKSTSFAFIETRRRSSIKKVLRKSNVGLLAQSTDNSELAKNENLRFGKSSSSFSGKVVNI